MELRAVRVFVAVADAGSVTAAAQDLHVAQPSLSRQLRRFEQELGLTLFDRRDNRLALSAAGRRFLPVARDLLARADLAREAATALREGALASVVLSATGTTLTDVVAPFLATWDAEDPVPAVWEELPADIYASVDRGADLAVGTDPPPSHLAHLALASLPVWAYVPPDDPWRGRSMVDLTELVTRRLLLLGREQHARVALDRALAHDSVATGAVIEFSAPEVAQAVAAAGRGVAVVSDDQRFDLLPVAISCSDGPVVVTLHAAWAPDHHAAPTLRSLAERLRSFCGARYGAGVLE